MLDQLFPVDAISRDKGKEPTPTAIVGARQGLETLSRGHTRSRIQKRAEIVTAGGSVGQDDVLSLRPLYRVEAKLWKGPGMTIAAFRVAGDLVWIAITLEDANVRFYNIGADVVTPWTTPYGGAVFLPRWEDIEPVVAEAMAPIPEARLNRTYMPVEVWNGTANPDWDLLAVDRVYRAGFPADVGEPDRHDYAETHLIIFSERVKGTGAGYLQQMFGIPDSQVVHQPGGSSTYGFRLVVGADYETCPDL